MSLRPNPQFLAEIATASAPVPASIHVAQAQPGDAAKIKYETFSPIEEYQIREGQTVPLDEEFHAVLSGDYRGAGTVTANGILIKAAELVGPANVAQGVTFWHPDSDLCNRVATGPVQVNYTYNPARPEVVHLWSLEWVYLETLPAKAKAPILDNTALAEAARHHKRQIKRFTDHAQALHSGDTVKALADLSRNASEMGRVAVSLPLPEAARPAPDLAPETGFDTARRDTDLIASQSRQTRALIDQADADLTAVRRQRRASTPVAVAAHDPLDDL